MAYKVIGCRMECYCSYVNFKFTRPTLNFPADRSFESQDGRINWSGAASFVLITNTKFTKWGYVFLFKSFLGLDNLSGPKFSFLSKNSPSKWNFIELS